MRNAKMAAIGGCLGLLLLGSGCKQQPGADSPAQSAENHAKDEQAVRDTDAQWAKAAGSHDVDATVAYYADDAVLMPPNGPKITGKQDIRAAWVTLAAPDVVLTWGPQKVEVSQSGDLAYIVGTYQDSFKDAKGKPATDRGKTLEVFKKQTDGTWKAVVDMYSSDLAAPPA
jgi:uncharacterized protein (TIGR02246 family)